VSFVALWFTFSIDPMAQPLLRMSGISKRFPGVQALDAVDFEVAAGEVHALLGENGAGKSTLLKILAGAQAPDAGSIEFQGQEVELPTPHAAQRQGIVTIYQEFNLIPHLSVAENVFIGRAPRRAGFIDWRAMAAQTRAITGRLGVELDPQAQIRDLSVAEQQMVEIARAMSMASRLIVMDEPSSALSTTEVARLFKIIRDLKAGGVSIIFVTHRLDEVMEICDRFTVLRDGRRVGGGAVATTSVAEIIKLMVGRAVDSLFQRREAADIGEVALRVAGLTRRGDAQDPHATVLDNVSLEVRRGEILGLAGLVGAGRTELARAVFGADPFDAGEVHVGGRRAQIRTPQDAIRHGIGLVPEDRKQQALFLALAVRTNVSLAALGRLLRWRMFVDEQAESALVEQYRQTLNIRMSGPEQLVANLSGGNQQKVVLARWLALKPKVLIVDEPTRGIDVAAKVEVHHLLFEMARQGIAVIAISSELPEVLAISDRIVTLCEGRVTGEVAAAGATQEQLMAMMTDRGRRAAA